jgi:hypothetical protein
MRAHMLNQCHKNVHVPYHKKPKQMSYAWLRILVLAQNFYTSYPFSIGLISQINNYLGLAIKEQPLLGSFLQKYLYGQKAPT